MTRDEAIKYLRQIYPNGGHCWLDSQRIEAIEMAISALSQPSLPSELDEAAEDYEENKVHSISALGTDKDGFAYYMRTGTSFNDAFKAGAEWMAGQGVKADFEVCKLANRAWLTAIDEKQFQNELYDKFNAGDKVVVQIRKK